MPEHDEDPDGRGLEHGQDDGQDDGARGYEDLVDRLSGGLRGISPRADAAGIVRGALRRRRRRRAVASGLVVAAVVVAAGVGGYLGVRALPSGGPAPASDSPTPQAFVDGQYQPARFFADVVGGFASPRSDTHHLVRGERFTSQIIWRPDPETGRRYLVVIAVEKFQGSPQSACAELTMGGGDACRTQPDGSALTYFDDPADRAYDDPVHRATPLEGTKLSSSTVHGITYLRTEGIAVSVLSCTCPVDGDPVSDVPPPLTDAQLETLASSPTWRNYDDGGG